MSHWPFVIAAYGLTAAGTLILVAVSWVAMRRAERLAERIGQDR